jgi:hypothetical protein
VAIDWTVRLKETEWIFGLSSKGSNSTRSSVYAVQEAAVESWQPFLERQTVNDSRR